MHLNPIHPNIFHDMQAAANGRDLRNQRRGNATAKRHLIPRKSYRHCVDAQVIDKSTGQILVQGVYNYRLGDH